MKHKKIKNQNQLIKDINRHKKNRKKIVFTNGCFDILHRGHVTYLQKAKAMGGILIVALNTDASVKKIKGKSRPLFKLHDRQVVLSALDCVDYVTSFSQQTPIEIIKKIKPDIIAKGGDWTADNIVGADYIKKYGGKAISIKYEKGYSTTGLIEKIVKKTR